MSHRLSARLVALVVSACTLVPLAARAQAPMPPPAPASWRWLSPRLTGADLRDIVFADAQRGFAVGAKSTVLRTTDGGSNWDVRPTPVGADLVAVSASGSTVVAVGNAGLILRSTDGGTTFAPVSPPAAGQDYVDVQLVGATAGFLVARDGSFYSTADGFRTLTARARITAGQPVAMWFDSPTRGWVVGSASGGTAGFIARTQDGGTSFLKVHDGAGGAYQSVAGLSFFGQAVVIAAGATLPRAVWSDTGGGPGTWEDAELPGAAISGMSLTMVTDEQAEFWFAGDDGLWGIRVDESDLQRPLTQSRPRLWSVASPVGGTAYAVGEGGTIVRAIYGQPSAFVVNGNRKERYTAGAFATADGQAGTLVDNQPSAPRLWLTTNGATSFTAGSIAPEEIVDVSFVDARNGFAVSLNGAVFASGDGGATGVRRSSLTISPQAIAFATLQAGYAGGQGIYRTSNGGVSWVEAVPAATTGRVTDVAVSGSSAAAAVTAGGLILVRSGALDGTWTSVHNDPASPLRAVAIGQDGRIVAGGASAGRGVYFLRGTGSAAFKRFDAPRPVVSIAASGAKTFLLLDDGSIVETAADGSVASTFHSRARLLSLVSRTTLSPGGSVVPAPLALGEFGALLAYDANATPPPPNLPPVVVATPPMLTLAPGGTATITASAKDPELAPVTLEWSDANGTGLEFDAPTAQTVTVAWTLTPPPGTKAVARVTACDPLGACASFDVTIVAPDSQVNRPPEALANGVSVKAGDIALIDGSGSRDPDGEPLTYKWTQLSGPPASLLGPATSSVLALASPASAATLVFELLVCDPRGLCGRVEALVIVTAPNVNSPPIAQTTGDLVVPPGSTVLLDATRSIDPEDGRPAAFRWQQVSGPRLTITDGTSAVAQVTAGGPGETYRFTVTVCDRQNACSGAGINVKVSGETPVNRPPTITVADARAAVGERVVLSARVSDPDNDPVTVTWTDVQPELGLALRAAPPTDAVFVVPEAAAGRTLRFEAKACDTRGACVGATVTVVVAPIVPPELVANAGEDQRTSEGADVVVDGSRSTGAILSHRWEQVSGPPVVLADLGAFRARFAAPRGPATIVLRLTVFSRDGRTAQDDVSVFVEGPQGPVADAGRDVAVGFGARVQLDGRGSRDPLGRALTYSWAAPDGISLAGADQPLAIFFAPARDVRLVFVLTVCAGDLCSTDDVTVAVRSDGNLPPIVLAGADRTVEAGRVVPLDGTRSIDPEGGALTYRWTQVSGPPVSVADPDASWTTVQVPVAGEESTLVFQLEACDVASTCATDTVSFRVLPRAEGTPQISLALVGHDDGRVPELEAFELELVVRCPVARCRDAGEVRLFSGPPIERTDTTGLAWRTPRVSRAVPFEFEASVCDVDGRCATTSLAGVVEDSVNEAPVALTGDRQLARARQLVVLDAGRSYDPNGESVTFAWKQVSGPVALELTASDVARPRFVVPAEGAEGDYAFSVEVCDERGECAQASVVVTVAPGAPANRAPLAEAGDDRVIVAGGELALDGGRSFDADGDALRYVWSVIGDAPGVNVLRFDTARATLVTAEALADPVLVQLEVCDSFDACDSDTLSVRVHAAPELPPQGSAKLEAPVEACGCAGADGSAAALLGLFALALAPRLRKRR